jgi:hypothetical protein
LIGWSGGLNHYSWVRLASDGSASFFDGANIVANAPRWCTGAGNWIYTAKPNTIGLYPPAACAGFEALTFESFGPPSSYAKGSILSATLSTGIQPSYLEAYKYGPAQCDAAMTSCADPFL